MAEALGKYELLRHLASGGMANVYLARSTGLGGFERHVVIKTLHVEHLDDPAYVGMFLDEARLVAGLHHQNIAQVFEVGRADDGRYFIAMEYVHGESLRAVLDTAGERHAKLTLELGLTAVCAAAAGLHYAHERRDASGRRLDIVHRDVSPSNVLAAYDGSVKLIDFGIAKAATRTVATQTGFMKGKAGYMAPEQARGYPVDRRSDVFALGVIAYELTTQIAAFRASSQFETVYKTVHGEVTPPSQLCAGYPRALEDVVMTALETDPDDRFQDAAEFRRALESIAGHLGVALGPASVTRTLDELFGARPEPWLVDGPRVIAPPPAPSREAAPISPMVAAATVSGGKPAPADEPDELATRRFTPVSPAVAVAAVPAVVATPVAPAAVVAVDPVDPVDLSTEHTKPRRTSTISATVGELRPRIPARRLPRDRTNLIAGIAVACALPAGILVAMRVASSDDAPPEPPAERPVRARVAPKPPHVTITPMAASEPVPAPAPAAPAAPVVPAPAPATITLTVTSDPPGATVVLDGVRLGTAPYTTTLPARDAQGWLKVRMQHYIATKIQVPLDHDVTWSIALHPVTAPPAATPSAP